MVSEQRKTQAINLRMSPATKALLRAAAERDHRTLSNLLEVLIIEHCRRNGIEARAVMGARCIASGGTSHFSPAQLN